MIRETTIVWHRKYCRPWMIPAVQAAGWLAIVAGWMVLIFGGHG